jgi:hypothetical protein
MEGTPMIRILIIDIALTFALTAHAAPQKRTVEEVLTQLHGLCDRDYKPACIRFGLVIGRIPPREARKLRSDHPEWWWWERW